MKEWDKNHKIEPPDILEDAMDKTAGRDGTKTGDNKGVPEGRRIGYARVSTSEQNLDRQIQRLTDFGCVEIFQDHFTGSTMERPEYQKMLLALQPGDSLVVTEQDRLGRNTAGVASTLEMLTDRGVQVIILDRGEQPVDTGNAEAVFMYDINAAQSSYIRRVIAQKTRDGIAAARRKAEAEGVPFVHGRPRALTDRQVRLVAEMTQEGYTAEMIRDELQQIGVHTKSGKISLQTVKRARRKAREMGLLDPWTPASPEQEAAA